MDTTEFEQKVVSLSPRVYPMVVRLLGDQDRAKDAVQEVMLKLWDKRRQLGKHPNINGFVFLTAKNYCLDLLKRSRPLVIAIDGSTSLFTDTGSREPMEYEELQKAIRSILKSLPAPQSEVLIMRDLDGMEFNEIAMVMNLKVEHLRVLLSRARKQVAKQLKTTFCYG